VEESIADINKLNTPDTKFWIHPLAVAETRSEARALRKLLRLRKIIAAEESTNVDEEKLNELIPWSPEDLISNEQISAINIMSSRLDINAWKFINSGKKQYKTVMEITKSTAANMLGQLNKYQRSVIEIPPHLVGYQKDWDK